MDLLTDLLIALAAAGLLVIEHYFPWQKIIGRPLPRLAAYVLGLFAIAAPVSLQLLFWGDARATLLLWSAIVAGGAVVGLCYALDDWMDARAARREEAEVVKALREKL